MAGEPIQRNEILVAYKQKEYREKMKRDGSGMEKKKYILLDVGGTEIKGSVSDRNGVRTKIRKFPAQAQKSAPEQEERANNEQVPFFNEEPETITLDFRVWVTAEQMYALRDFLVSNRIRYGKVPKESEV